MGLRRRVAAFLGNGVGLTAPFIDDRLGHAHGNQAGGHALVRPRARAFSTTGTRVVRQTPG